LSQLSIIGQVDFGTREKRPTPTRQN
jgi:hypothetical protein